MGYSPTFTTLYVFCLIATWYYHNQFFTCFVIVGSMCHHVMYHICYIMFHVYHMFRICGAHMTRAYVSIAQQQLMHTSSMNLSSSPSTHHVNILFFIGFLFRIISCITMYVPMMYHAQTPMDEYRYSDTVNIAFHVTNAIM